jgi:hypothetical protein
MSLETEVCKHLGLYLKRNQQSQVTYSSFLGYLERQLQQNEQSNEDLEELRKDPHQVLSNVLRNLEKNQKVILLRSSDQPLTIQYPEYFISEITHLYIEASQQMTAPLPAENLLTHPVPEQLIQPIDIKTEFVSWLHKALPDGSQSDSEDNNQESDSIDPRPVLRLLFPDGLPSLISTKEALQDKMVVSCVQKLRNYLINPKNMAYIKQKLAPVFKGREIPLRDILQQILTSPEQCAKGILSSTDFLFQFWTHLSTNIIKEFNDKQDKQIDEQNYCQASYLLGYYSVYCKGIEQRKKDSESGLKSFINMLKKPPYAFTMQEMYTFTDDKGVLLLQKCTREQLHSFIADNMRSKDGNALPVLLRLQLPNGKQVFVVYESIPQIIISLLSKVQKQFRDYYLLTWQKAFKEGKTLSTIESPKKFELHVEERLKHYYPLLYSVLKFDSIFLVSQESYTKAEAKQILISLIDIKNKTLKNYSDILNLSHSQLLSDTKIMLPFWIVVPLLKNIVLFFRKLFLGKDFVYTDGTGLDYEGQEADSSAHFSQSSGSTAKELGAAKQTNPTTSSSQSAKSQKAEFKNKVLEIAEEFTYPGKSLEQSLKASIDEWNTLLEPKAKQNLIEDVNSMCRDFLRGLKISYRKNPPSVSDIQEMAKRLSTNDVFSRIRNRDGLREYIELYFLKILSK